MSTLCTLRYHLAHSAHSAHSAHCAHYCFSHCFLFFAGPHWFRKDSNKLILATRRSDETRRRKTANGLLCCLWRRAEKPEKMTHCLAGGGYHSTGCIALLHRNDLASRQPEYLAEHRLLAFLGKKICHCIHDFHPKWIITRLGLPDFTYAAENLATNSAAPVPFKQGGHCIIL
jgi:hypothetical protein